jgi:hypothetical protein
VKINLSVEVDKAKPTLLLRHINNDVLSLDRLFKQRKGIRKFLYKTLVPNFKMSGILGYKNM